MTSPSVEVYNPSVRVRKCLVSVTWAAKARKQGTARAATRHMLRIPAENEESSGDRERHKHKPKERKVLATTQEK
ncbi:hypothetical protein MTO96_001434 [Rhipicephalus appendiculatus]